MQQYQERECAATTEPLQEMVSPLSISLSLKLRIELQLFYVFANPQKRACCALEWLLPSLMTLQSLPAQFETQLFEAMWAFVAFEPFSIANCYWLGKN